MGAVQDRDHLGVILWNTAKTSGDTTGQYRMRQRRSTAHLQCTRFEDDKGRTPIHLIAISVKDVIFDCDRRFAVTTSFNAVSKSWKERAYLR